MAQLCSPGTIILCCCGSSIRSPAQAVDVGLPPAGLYAPGEHFAEAWVELDQYRQSTLGWAAAPEQTYVRNYPAAAPSPRPGGVPCGK